METLIHHIQGQDIAEVLSDAILIQTAQDGLDIMMELAFSGVSKIIFHQKNISPEFFNLKSGLAGEILQKFVNYRMQVAIVGDFKNIQSESLRAFIIESNRGKQNFFVEDLETAKAMLTK